MRKKGFTLIELLAVIVIVAFISVIIIPAIGKIITESKKATFATKARGVARAANYEFKRLEMIGGIPSEIIFQFKNGIETSNVEGAKLEYDGKKIENGIVKINNEGEVALTIHDGEYCAEKHYIDSEVTITDKSKEDCMVLSTFNCGEDLLDDRDDNIYKTVKIGDQCWFAEDLRYDCDYAGYNNRGPLNSWSGSNNCGHSGYDGFLYQWPVAMDGSTQEGAQGLCPKGWYVPTDNDWKELAGYADSVYGIGNREWDYTGYRGENAGNKLKSIYWDGTDDYSFNAFPNGYRNAMGSLNDVGLYGHWWTSSTVGPNAYFHSFLSGSGGVGRNEYSKATGRAVRCLLGS